MMGEPVGRQDRLFYEFDLEDMVPGDHLATAGSLLLWTRAGCAGQDEGALQPARLPFGLSRADGADADCRLLPLDPHGAALVPGGKDEPGLALVLRLRVWRTRFPTIRPSR